MQRFIVIDDHGQTRGGIEVPFHKQVGVRKRAAARGWRLLPA